MLSDFRAKSSDRCTLNDEINGQCYLSINHAANSAGKCSLYVIETAIE